MTNANFNQCSVTQAHVHNTRTHSLARWITTGVTAIFLATTVGSGVVEAQMEMMPPPMGPANIVIPDKTAEDSIEVPKASWKLNKIRKQLKKKHGKKAKRKMKRALRKLEKQERKFAKLQEALAKGRNEKTTPASDEVKVMLVLDNKGMATVVQESIETLGGEVTAYFRKWMTAIIPVDALKDVSEIPGVKWVDEPPPVGPVDAFQTIPPMTSFNQVPCQHYVSQGVQASGADKWHRVGFSGQGVKVAILDSFGLVGAVQSCGELPSVTAHAPIGQDGLPLLNYSSAHGTAVAEIIHDMAPEAQLTLASPGGDPVNMARYIVDLAKTGHKVISSSIGMVHFGPGDGSDDMLAEAIQEAEDHGALYVQAAGNQAQFHWDGVFRDTNRNGFHEFTSSGMDEINWLNQGRPIPAGQPLSVSLRWSDWQRSGQDYDMYIIYSTGQNFQIVANSQNQQGYPVFAPPVEQINVKAPAYGYYGILIVWREGNGQQVLDLNGYNLPPFLYNVRERSLIDAATPESAFSIAAVDAGTFKQEPYSSEGPLHGPGGLHYGGDANQPRMAGFANVDTMAGYVEKGAPFNGTSAATPHVSGAAALVLSAFPNFTPAQVKEYLETHALDAGEQGYDMQFGKGILSLGEPPVPPRAPVLITPSGVVADTTPTYSWYASPSATWYYLYIVDSAGAKMQGWISAVNAGCGSGESTCSVTLAKPLALGQGWWAAFGENSFGRGDWSSVESFTIVQ